MMALTRHSGGATVIDGKAFAQKLREKIAAEVRTFSAAPGLAVILVGEDPASQVYVRNKEKAAKDAGFASFVYRLPAATSQQDLISLVHELNQNEVVHGILVQLPLPKHIDETEVLRAVDPRKDVDGFHAENVGRLWSGLDGLVPCTPKGCIFLLKECLGDLSGKNAVVVGRSNIVGKPMAALLLRESCTVTITHSKTKNLPEICSQADILVAAVGRPKMVKAGWVKPGAAVIDVGINRLEDGSLCGDVDFDDVAGVAGCITPVPGGVGPMTIACLLANTLEAFKKR